MLILVDAMGGDNAPDSVVNGCIDAINEAEGFDILLLGDSKKINRIVSERKFVNNRLKIQHTSEVITNDDMPTKAIKLKKDSSMVKGFNILKEQKGDVFVSAGNSGALLAGALLILGRIKGVDRPALGAVIPTTKGSTFVIDVGLNSVCKPINFLQFGIMGSIYIKNLLNIENPRVGLLNIGSEEKKGNEVIKQAYSLLSDSNLNFIGNIEGNDVLHSKADVVVCDGFVGNVLLKFMEGAASFFFGLMKNLFMTNICTKIAALLVKKHIKVFKRKVDADEHGGAPILGVNGIVIKSHGNSNAKTIKSVVLKAYNLTKNPVLEQFKEEFKNMEVDDVEYSN